MKPFVYEEPRTLPQALHLLESQGGRAKAIAGGTDLLVRIKERRSAPEMLVDIQGLAELKGLDLSQNGLRRVPSLRTPRSRPHLWFWNTRPYWHRHRSP